MSPRAIADKKFSHDGKTVYETIVLATKAAYNLDQIRKTTYVPYKCRWCYGYHIGRKKDRSMFNYDFSKEGGEQ